MKLLSIQDSKGYYLAGNGEHRPLDQVTKEDLLRLVEVTLTTEAEMDDYNASLLQNQAHQIIYENIWSKLRDLAARRKEFLDESKRAFLPEYERYKSGIAQQVDGEGAGAEPTVPNPVSG